MTAAMLATAVTLALTGYVHKTGKDFSRMGGFLFSGLIVVLLASITAIFVPATQAGVSAVAALLFSGFILFDTSRLFRGSQIHAVWMANHAGEGVNRSKKLSCYGRWRLGRSGPPHPLL